MFFRKKRIHVHSYKHAPVALATMKTNRNNNYKANEGSKTGVISEPVVKILYSESNHPSLHQGVLPFKEANTLFEHRNCWCKERDIVEHVIYELSYLMNGEMCTKLCSQLLGDDEGAVITHLRIDALTSLKTLETINGPEQVNDVRNPFSIVRTSCENLLNVVLPQLEQLCSMQTEGVNEEKRCHE